jgi:hypothetical protein
MAKIENWNADASPNAMPKYDRRMPFPALIDLSKQQAEHRSETEREVHRSATATQPQAQNHAAAYCVCSGRKIDIRVPCELVPVSLSTSIRPPWPSMNCFATKRPIPVPIVARVV